jgi:hypothetical protein
VGLRLVSIAALAAVLATGLGAPATGATVTAQVKAQVVKPLAISKVQDLNLGTIVLGPGSWSGAIVRLARTGSLTCPANVTCTGATSVAIYNVAGSNGQTVRINVPAVTLVNQLDSTKKLTLTPDNQATVTLTNSGNPGTNVPIGGSITVDSATAGGTYVGTFNVTADYQ